MESYSLVIWSSSAKCPHALLFQICSLLTEVANQSRWITDRFNLLWPKTHFKLPSHCPPRKRDQSNRLGSQARGHAHQSDSDGQHAHRCPPSHSPSLRPRRWWRAPGSRSHSRPGHRASSCCQPACFICGAMRRSDTRGAAPLPSDATAVADAADEMFTWRG